MASKRATAGNGHRQAANRRGEKVSALAPIAPRMLAETVVEAIVEAAAKGHFLPGDRIVEADVARQLNVSRVPVREALRLLESQGIVENIPYRGMRLMSITPESMKSLRKVRLVLELLAGEELQAMVRTDPQILEPLSRCVDDLRAAARANDTLKVALLDIDFHRIMCELTGNSALMRAWEPLARQLTIVIGLSTYLQESLKTIVKEHVDLIEVLRNGDGEQLRAIMEEHILEVPDAVNYELLRAQRPDRPGSQAGATQRA
ncbi:MULTISPECIES: GntR family transcriptional regulator [unclassified Roseitalea]|uniref:GntR family transcriptional regulator n=1 Tax=unclassified Roseitalea TaxID=2639107 RepID=UPI00273E27F7|nr:MULTISPECIES: GntR family transcriptional regulator [unclassified Roseitalea]